MEMDVLITLLGLSAVVFVHECGHLFAAKWGGIGVLEFSIGMGPKLVGATIKGVPCSFRLLPIGGYVKLAGMDAALSDSPDSDPNTFFQNRPLVNRFATIIAGSLMNLVFALFVFFMLFYFWGIPSVSSTIQSVEQASPAFEAGLQVGDVITHVNGAKLVDVDKDFISLVKSGPDAVHIRYQRQSSVLQSQISPYFDNTYEVYRLGLVLQSTYSSFLFFDSITGAFSAFSQSVSFFVMSFQQLFSGNASLADLSGPVGIVQVASHQLDSGIANFLALLALISITLGFINLLPIPVLDGGHLMFLLYEALFSRKVPKKIEMALMNTFTLLFIALMFFVLFNDIVNWSDRSDLLKTMQTEDS